jgi:hypothetical protein
VPELSRRVLLAIAVLLAFAAAVGSYRVDTPTKVVAAKTPYRGHSSPADPIVTIPTTTTAAPTTSTTAVPTASPAPTTTTTRVVTHSVATTTTTVLAVTHPTTTTLVPTTPCAWSAETFPQLNGASPTLFVHIVAPALPNTTFTVRLLPHNGSVVQSSRVVGSDGTGHVNTSFPVSAAQLGSQVDLTAGASANGGEIACSPKLFTTTLTPVL